MYWLMEREGIQDNFKLSMFWDWLTSRGRQEEELFGAKDLFLSI